MPRPRLVLAMIAGLAPLAFTDRQRERLAAAADVLDPVPLENFVDERAEDLLGDCEVLLAHWGCPPVDAGALERAPNLRLLAYGAGTVKGVVTEAVWARDVVVTSAAAANAVPVAEFTLAAILFANKAVFAAREWMRDPEVRIRRPNPVGNYAKQVGVIGASHVGRKVLELLRPFHLTAVVADPYLPPDEATALGARLVDLDELLRTSDVVSIHAPDLPETRGMIGADQLALMQDGAMLINTARGALVDTAALEAALMKGRISAVLDVTEPEPLPRSSVLFELPNVFLTPHLAGAQGSELARLADLAIEEVERFGRGEPPRHPVRRQDLDRIA